MPTRALKTLPIAALAALLAAGFAHAQENQAPGDSSQNSSPPPDQSQSSQPANDQSQPQQMPGTQPATERNPDSVAPPADQNANQNAGQDNAPAQPAPPEAAAIPVPQPKPKKEKKEGATQLEDIEVTASKRAKSERDLPGSVGAIRGEDLEKMKAQGLRDYLKLVPGVTYLDVGNEESVPVIRGIASSAGLQDTAVTTGIFLDDMPFGDLFVPLSLPDMNPFDLERTEVLKGPQGTLFGGSALAGAIRYIVHKPDHSVWEIKGSETMSSVRYGGGLAPVTAGAVNIPLFGDALAIRAVAISRKDTGLYDEYAFDNSGNTLRAAPNADKLNQVSGRVLASWNTPIDALKVQAFYFKQKTHSDDFGYADQSTQFESGQPFNPPPASSSDPHPIGWPFPSPRDHDFAGGNLLANYDFGWSTLTSSSNYMRKHNLIDTHQEYAFGLDHQNSTEFFNLLWNKVRGYTQELRLASPQGGDFGDWEWVIGGAYMKWNDSIWQFGHLGPNIADPTDPSQVPQSQGQTEFLWATFAEIADEKAVFGEATRRFGEAWEGTVGARWYKNHLDSDIIACGAEILALAQMPCTHDIESTGANGINPKLSLRYLHNRNFQLYALAAKGFQFGGFQINPPIVAFQQAAQNAGHPMVPYKSSSLWNYESGIRTEWLDRRLRFDITFFYLDWKDLQLTVPVPISNGSSVTFGVLTNVGRAHSTGIETSLEVLPFAGAKWTSTAAWINAVTDVATTDPSGTVLPAGTRLPGTPRFQWANVVSYAHALPYFEEWELGPVITESNNTRSPNQLNATGDVGGFFVLDARLALTKPSSRFAPEFMLGANNLTDVRGVSVFGDGNEATNGNYVQAFHFVQPRTILMSVALKY